MTATPFSTTAFGQHLALAIAAHLARTQLVPDPLNAYDAQHLRDSVEVVARALTRVAPLYVNGAADGELRQLSEAELEGAKVKNGADTLVLRDGRAFSAVLIKRADLRQAIAILKAVGIHPGAGGTRQRACHRDRAHGAARTHIQLGDALDERGARGA